MNQRLLLISSNSSDRGGGERYLVYLAQGLRLLNWEVHVLLSDVNYMDGWAQELTAAGAQVHRCRLLGLRSRPLRFVQAIQDTKQQKEIAEACRQIAPNAILVNQQYDEDGLDYLAGALMANVAPVGATMHMPMTANKHKRPFGNWRGNILKRWYKKHSYCLILVSQGSQTEFENYYSYPRPTKVVNYGCPFPQTTTISHSPLPSNWIEPLPTIGFSGQFVYQKNLQLLVDAWLWTIKQGTSSRLVLIGDGVQRQELETSLNQAAPEHMWHITGWQEHSEAYLPILDIYAMTSHFEGLPLALIEAVGKGIPSVVTNFNGATDVAARASWVSIAAPTPEAVGEALIKSINQLSWLKQQARSGQQDFQNYFSLKRMASDTLAALGVA